MFWARPLLLGSNTAVLLIWVRISFECCRLYIRLITLWKLTISESKKGIRRDWKWQLTSSKIVQINLIGDESLMVGLVNAVLYHAVRSWLQILVQLHLVGKHSHLMICVLSDKYVSTPRCPKSCQFHTSVDEILLLWNTFLQEITC